MNISGSTGKGFLEIHTQPVVKIAATGTHFTKTAPGAGPCPAEHRLEEIAESSAARSSETGIAKAAATPPGRRAARLGLVARRSLSQALRDTLARINPHVRVTACHLRLNPSNIGEVFGHAQVLVEAFDLAEQKVMLIETFAARFPDRPMITGSGMAGFGPANTISTHQVARNLYLCGDGSTAAAPGTGLMAPRVGVTAHHQANAVLRLLLGEAPEAESS